MLPRCVVVASPAIHNPPLFNVGFGRQAAKPPTGLPTPPFFFFNQTNANAHGGSK